MSTLTFLIIVLNLFGRIVCNPEPTDKLSDNNSSPASVEETQDPHAILNRDNETILQKLEKDLQNSDRESKDIFLKVKKQAIDYGAIIGEFTINELLSNLSEKLEPNALINPSQIKSILNQHNEHIVKKMNVMEAMIFKGFSSSKYRLDEFAKNPKNSDARAAFLLTLLDEGIALAHKKTSKLAQKAQNQYDQKNGLPSEISSSNTNAPTALQSLGKVIYGIFDVPSWFRKGDAKKKSK